MRIKKIGAALLAGWLVTLLLPTATAAATDAVVSLSSAPVRGYVGERITVTLSVDQAESLSIASGQMTLSYDTTKLRYVSCRAGAALAGCMMADNESASGVCVGFLTVDAIAARGEALLFTFEVLTDAPNSVTTLSLHLDEWVDGVTERNYASQVAIELGALTLNPTVIPDGRRGDVNGDGQVSVSDVRLALRAAVGKITLSEAQILAADINGDGQVSVSDVRQILRVAVGKA